MMKLVFVILVFLGLSYLPIYRNYIRVPTDRFYYGGDDYPLDMTGDLAYIQQGYRGKLLSSFNYSTHLKNDPTFLKLEYVYLGHLARLIHIQPTTMFLVSRFLLSLALLAIISIIVRAVFHSVFDQIIALILVLFETSIISPSNPWSFVQAAAFDVMVFARSTLAMPHYLLGAFCGLVSLYCLSKVLENQKRHGIFYISLLLGFICSLAYAPTAVLIVTSLPLYCCFLFMSQAVNHKKIHISLQSLIILGIYAAVLSAQVLYVRYVITYSWKEMNAGSMELLNPFRVSFIEYVLAIGPTYLLSWFALPKVLKSAKPLYFMLFTWVIMHPFGEFILSNMLHINPIRYFLIPYYVPFGILSAISIKEMSMWVEKHAVYLKRQTVMGICVCLILLSGWYGYKQTIARMNLCFCTAQFFDYGYPKNNLMHAINWLSMNTNSNDIVLSDYYAGTLIPAFSGNTVFVSWWFRLIKPPDLYHVESQIRRFYSGDMGQDEVTKFLQSERISYILFSEYEQQFRPEMSQLPYTNVHLVYDKENTKIYKVQ